MSWQEDPIIADPGQAPGGEQWRFDPLIDTTQTPLAIDPEEEARWQQRAESDARLAQGLNDMIAQPAPQPQYEPNPPIEDWQQRQQQLRQIVQGPEPSGALGPDPASIYAMYRAGPLAQQYQQAQAELDRMQAPPLSADELHRQWAQQQAAQGGYRSVPIGTLQHAIETAGYAIEPVLDLHRSDQLGLDNYFQKQQDALTGAGPTRQVNTGILPVGDGTALVRDDVAREILDLAYQQPVNLRDKTSAEQHQVFTHLPDFRELYPQGNDPAAQQERSYWAAASNAQRVGASERQPPAPDTFAQAAAPYIAAPLAGAGRAVGALTALAGEVYGTARDEVLDFAGQKPRSEQSGLSKLGQNIADYTAVPPEVQPTGIGGLATRVISGAPMIAGYIAAGPVGLGVMAAEAAGNQLLTARQQKGTIDPEDWYWAAGKGVGTYLLMRYAAPQQAVVAPYIDRAVDAMVRNAPIGYAMGLLDKGDTIAGGTMKPDDWLGVLETSFTFAAAGAVMEAMRFGADPEQAAEQMWRIESATFKEYEPGYRRPARGSQPLDEGPSPEPPGAGAEPGPAGPQPRPQAGPTGPQEGTQPGNAQQQAGGQRQSSPRRRQVIMGEAEARQVLGFSADEPVTLDGLGERFRQEAMRLHPDNGGDPARFAMAVEARNALRDIVARSEGPGPTSAPPVATPQPEGRPGWPDKISTEGQPAPELPQVQTSAGSYDERVTQPVAGMAAPSAGAPRRTVAEASMEDLRALAGQFGMDPDRPRLQLVRDLLPIEHTMRAEQNLGPEWDLTQTLNAPGPGPVEPAAPAPNSPAIPESSAPAEPEPTTSQRDVVAAPQAPAKPADLSGRIINFLGDHPDASIQDIGRAVGVRPFGYGDTGHPLDSPLNRALTDMAKSGQVTVQNKGFGEHPYFTLAQAGAEAVGQQPGPAASPAPSAPEPSRNMPESPIAAPERAQGQGKQPWEMTEAEFEAPDLKGPHEPAPASPRVETPAEAPGPGEPAAAAPVAGGGAAGVDLAGRPNPEPEPPRRLQLRDTSAKKPGYVDELDPSDPAQAQRIVDTYAGEMKEWAGYKYRSVESRPDANLTPETNAKIDAAYKTLYVPVASPVADTELFALPGHEAEVAALGQKMARIAASKQPVVPARLMRRQPEENPIRPMPKEANKPADLVDAIRVATAKETSRYAMGAVQFDAGGKTMTATDGRRLFTVTAKLGKFGEPGLFLIGKGGAQAGTPAEKGATFPPYRDVLNSAKAGEVVAKIGLEWTIRRLRQIEAMQEPGPGNISALVAVNPNGSLAFAASTGAGQVEVNYQPGAREMGAVNPAFLREALEFHYKASGDVPVSLWWAAPNRPLYMRSSGMGRAVQTVLMPVNTTDTVQGTAEQMGRPEALAERARLEAASLSQPAAPEGIPEAGPRLGASLRRQGVIRLPPIGKAVGAVLRDVKNMLYGPQSIGAKDVVPVVVKTAKGLAEVVSQVRKIMAPHTRGAIARAGGTDMARVGSELALYSDRMEEALKPARHFFDLRSDDQNLEFYDKMERGQGQGSILLTQAGKLMRDALDAIAAEVQDLGIGKLEQVIRDYMPHIYADPEKAAEVLGMLMGQKRPAEGNRSWLKQRTIPYLKDAVAAGLEPLSYNPVDLVLLRMRQMKKFVLAHRMLQKWQEEGFAVYVPVMQPDQAPPGFVKVDDHIFTVYGPPTFKTKEYLDRDVYGALSVAASNLGVAHHRVASAGRGRLGYSETGGDIYTQANTETSVLAHEIGHQLDDKYGLWDLLLQRNSGKSHKAGRSELRDIADLTERGKVARSKAEKIAQVLEAYVHARDRMKEVAPRVFAWFDNWVKSIPEIRHLADLRPNLPLQEIETEKRHGGLLTMGHYWLPSELAQVVNNWLSPSLRSKSGVLRALYGLGSVMNQAQLALGFFHLGFVTFDTIASKQALALQYLVDGRPIKALMQEMQVPFSPLRALVLGNAIAREWFKPGSEGGPLAKLLEKIFGVKEMLAGVPATRLGPAAGSAFLGHEAGAVQRIEQGGGRFHMEGEHNDQAVRGLVRIVAQAWQQLASGHVLEAAGTGARAILRLPAAAIRAISYPVLGWAVPRLKAAVFADLSLHAIEQLGAKASDENEVQKVLFRVSAAVDDRLGQVVYDNWFLNRYVKEIAMLFTRALGFTGGTYRSMAKAIGEIPGLLRPLVGKKPVLGESLAYWMAAGGIVAGALGSLMQYLLTGESPKSAKDIYFPRTGRRDVNGDDIRITMPSYTKDVWHLYTEPGKALLNKSHPIVSFLNYVWRNEDYYGTQVRNPDAPLKDQAGQMGQFFGKQFLPFSVTGAQRMAQSPDATARDLALPFFGLSPAPKRLGQSPAEVLAEQLSREKFPRGARTLEDAEAGRKRGELYKGVKRDEQAGIDAAVQAIEAGDLRPDQLRGMVKRSQMTPLQFHVARLDAADAMKVWKAATPEERKEIELIMLKKIGHSKLLRPEQRMQYIDQVSPP